MLVYKKLKEKTEEFSVEMKTYGAAALLKKEDTKKYRALLTGKIITLFGRPSYITSDINKLYTYYIGAEYNGNIIVPIVLFFDGGGISFAAPSGFTETGALLGLVMKLRSAVPSSYEMKFAHEKISAEIVMGIKEGIPYYITEYNKR